MELQVLHDNLQNKIANLITLVSPITIIKTSSDYINPSQLMKVAAGDLIKMDIKWNLVPKFKIIKFYLMLISKRLMPWSLLIPNFALIKKSEAQKQGFRYHNCSDVCRLSIQANTWLHHHKASFDIIS